MPTHLGEKRVKNGTTGCNPCTKSAFDMTTSSHQDGLVSLTKIGQPGLLLQRWSYFYNVVKEILHTNIVFVKGFINKYPQNRKKDHLLLL